MYVLCASITIVLLVLFGDQMLCSDLERYGAVGSGPNCNMAAPHGNYNIIGLPAFGFFIVES